MANRPGGFICKCGTRSCTSSISRCCRTGADAASAPPSCEALQADGRAGGKGVGIMVEKFNPALRLYRRLGFTAIADHEVYLEMEWLPAGVLVAEPIHTSV